MVRLTAAVLGFALASGGCSFAMTRAPTHVSAPRETVRCTRSAAPPALDALAGVLLLVGALEFASSDCDPSVGDGWCPERQTARRTAAILGALSATYVAAAVVGGLAASSCRRAIALNRECMAGDARACDDLEFGRQASGWRRPQERCTLDSDCPRGTRCVASRCTCEFDDGCPASQRCEAGLCLFPGERVERRTR